jgi:hypothetical protein
MALSVPTDLGVREIGTYRVGQADIAAVTLAASSTVFTAPLVSTSIRGASSSSGSGLIDAHQAITSSD